MREGKDEWEEECQLAAKNVQCTCSVAVATKVQDTFASGLVHVRVYG